jgi:hypothetical protein
MTDAHERITLPPIGSFEISISSSSKYHSPFRAGHTILYRTGAGHLSDAPCRCTRTRKAEKYEKGV